MDIYYLPINHDKLMLLVCIFWMSIMLVNLMERLRDDACDNDTMNEFELLAPCLGGENLLWWYYTFYIWRLRWKQSFCLWLLLWWYLCYKNNASFTPTITNKKKFSYVGSSSSFMYEDRMLMIATLSNLFMVLLKNIVEVEMVIYISQ